MRPRRFIATVAILMVLSSLAAAAASVYYVRSHRFASYLATFLGPEATIKGYRCEGANIIVLEGLESELPSTGDGGPGRISLAEVRIEWPVVAGPFVPAAVDISGFEADLPADPWRRLLERRSTGAGLPASLERLTIKGAVNFGPLGEGRGKTGGRLHNIEAALSGPAGARRLEARGWMRGGDEPLTVKGSLAPGGRLHFSLPGVVRLSALSGAMLGGAPISASGTVPSLTGELRVPTEGGRWSAKVAAELRDVAIEALGAVKLVAERGSLELTADGDRISANLQHSPGSPCKLSVAGAEIDISEASIAFSADGDDVRVDGRVRSPRGLPAKASLRASPRGWSLRARWPGQSEGALREVLHRILGWADLPPGLGGEADFDLAGDGGSFEGSLRWVLTCSVGGPAGREAFAELSAGLAGSPDGIELTGGRLEFAAPANPWGQGFGLSRMRIDRLTASRRNRVPGAKISGRMTELAYKLGGTEVAVVPPIELSGRILRTPRGLKVEELAAAGPDGWSVGFSGELIATDGSQAFWASMLRLTNVPYAYVGTARIDNARVWAEYALDGPIRDPVSTDSKFRMTGGSFRSEGGGLIIEGIELDVSAPRDGAAAKEE